MFVGVSVGVVVNVGVLVGVNVGVVVRVGVLVGVSVGVVVRVGVLVGVSVGVVVKVGLFVGVNVGVVVSVGVVVNVGVVVKVGVLVGVNVGLLVGVNVAVLVKVGVVVSVGVVVNVCVFVDEIDKSLHPLLLRHLIDLFHEQAARIGSKAQLVFTTHDTSLMRKLTPDSFSPDDQRKFILRLDQIFGLYKNIESASQIKKIIDRDDACELLKKPEGIDFHYLEGWFGAVPIINFSEV